VGRVLVLTTWKDLGGLGNGEHEAWGKHIQENREGWSNRQWEEWFRTRGWRHPVLSNMRDMPGPCRDAGVMTKWEGEREEFEPADCGFWGRWRRPYYEAEVEKEVVDAFAEGEVNVWDEDWYKCFFW